MQIVNDIRAHVNKYIEGVVFNYGRPADTALASANLEIDNYFVHLDPVVIEGEIGNFEKAKIVLGFLLQDKPDSSFDEAESLTITESVEAIQDSATLQATAWLNDFLDNYKYTAINYTITPVTRIKNVMSGVILTVNFSYKQSC